MSESNSNNPHPHSHQNTLEMAQNSRKLERYFKIETFSIVTSKFQLTILFLIKIFSLIHFLLFYSKCEMKFYSVNIQTLIDFDYLRADAEWSLITYCNLLLSIVLAFSIIGVNLKIGINNENILSSLFQYASRRIFMYARCLVELNFTISMFTLLHSAIPQVVQFSIASLLAIITDIFNQNLIKKKDMMSCRSLSFLLFFRLITIVGHFLLYFSMFVMPNDITAYQLVLITHICFSVLLIFSYFSFGIKIYKNKLTILYLFGYFAVYFSLMAAIFIDLCIFSSKVYSNSWVLFYQTVGIIFVCGFLLLYHSFNAKIFKNLSSNHTSMKAFCIYQLLDQNKFNIEIDAILRGVILHHNLTCSHVDCYVQNQQGVIKDSKKNKYFNLKEVSINNRASLIKTYLKCLYQQQIEKASFENIDLYLQYLQFRFMKLRHFMFVSQKLQQIDINQLTIFQIIKVLQLKSNIKNQSNILQRFIPNTINYEDILQSQETFQKICSKILICIHLNLRYWQYINSSFTIDLSLLKQAVTNILRSTDQINAHWKSIAKYFNHNKKWKFHYICYNLYIKNQKTKCQFSEEFGANFSLQSLFVSSQFGADYHGDDKKVIQFSSKMLFQPQSCLIHVSCKGEIARIKNVSRYFSQIFGYSRQEIINQQLTQLMTESVRNCHHNLLQHWANEKANNPHSYKINEIYPVGKDGYIFSAYKQYKLFLSHTNQVEFVAVIKKNNKEDNILVLNSNMEIEGLSQSLFNTLNHFSGYARQTIMKMSVDELFPHLTKLFAQMNDLEKQKSFQDKQKSSKQPWEIYEKRSNNQSFQKRDCQIYFPKNQLEFLQGVETQQNAQKYQRYVTGMQIKRYSLKGSHYYLTVFQHLSTLNALNARHSRMFNLNSRDNLGKDKGQGDVEGSGSGSSRCLQINSKTISPSQNIFMKEQAEQFPASFAKIDFIITFLRIIFIISILILILPYIQKSAAYNDLQILMNSKYLLNQFYKHIFSLQNIYLSLENNINNVTISHATQQAAHIIKIYKTDGFKRLLFNEQLQSRKLYNTKYSTDLSEFTLLFTVLNDITSLSLDSIGSSSYVRYFSDLQAYTDSALTILYRDLMTNLMNSFRLNSLEIIGVFYIAIGLFLVINVIGIVLCLYCLFIILRNFKSLLEIFAQMDPTNIRAIQKYLGKVEEIFQHLNTRYFIQYQMMTLLPSIRNPTLIGKLAEFNLNKKSKHLKEGKLITSLKRRIVGIFIIITLCFVLIECSLHVYQMQFVTELNTYFDSSWRMPNYIIPNVFLTCLIKYKYQPPSQLDMQFCKQYIAIQQDIKLNDLIFHKQLINPYEIGEYQMLTGNICTIFQQHLWVYPTPFNCSSTLDHSLNQGVYGMLSYLLLIVKDTLMNVTAPGDDMIAEMYRSITFTDLCMDDIMGVWRDQFMEVNREGELYCGISLLVAVLLMLVLYIGLIECGLFSILKREYDVYRLMYTNCMPRFVIEDQKIIKARLTVEGFFSKS